MERRQEQVLLAALINHPALIAEHAEDLSELRLSAGDLGALCRALVDLAARDPDLDTTGVKRHLTDQGFSGVLGGILRPELYVHGRFARPEGTPAEARTGVQEVLEVYRRRQVASETEEAGRRLAESMTEDALARLEAKQRLLRDSEDEGTALDRLEEAAHRS